MDEPRSCSNNSCGRLSQKLQSPETTVCTGAVRVGVGSNLEMQELTSADEAEPSSPKQGNKKPNLSWRFSASKSGPDMPNVYYLIPGRQIITKDAIKPAIGPKQQPWGVDCYAIGRLLFDMLHQGPDDRAAKIMRAEATSVVRRCSRCDCSACAMCPWALAHCQEQCCVRHGRCAGGVNFEAN